jgi:hypothetical protein
MSDIDEFDESKFHKTFEITEIKYKKNKIEQPKAAQIGVIPEHPFRMYVVGASQSGKTNLILNLLTRPEFYGGYYGQNILVISPTARNLDKSYQVLGLPPENFYPCSPDVLSRIFELCKQAKLQNRDSPVLIILDDFIANRKFAICKELVELLVQSRHYNVSCMLLSQSYHRVDKTIRLNCSSIVYFKGSNRELEILADDFTPPGMSKRQFMRLISEITNPKYSFLFIDLNRTIQQGRYKQNLTKKIV